MSFKRAQDIVVAGFTLLVMSPVMAICACLIRAKLGSPVLFVQPRPGLHGRVFKLVKFRTMSNNAVSGSDVLSDDRRLTRFGKILRSTSLDELPTLINVLRGDMSLVGPRPLLVEYLPLYNTTQNRRHEVKPGVTGWAQVNGRNAITWEKKFDLDVWYVDNQSAKLDYQILCKTVANVIRRDGITLENHATTTRFVGSQSASDNANVQDN